MTSSFDTAVSTGSMVTGKWKKSQYLIERNLGEGANGKVYLVRKGIAVYAMKVGFDAIDLQSEINVLKQLSRQSGTFHSFLIDVDDFQSQGKSYTFYIMKYIKGQTLDEFLSLRGEEWLGLLGLNLLAKLSELHALGWIFGDLKMENILVSGYGQVELVDFGGVTDKGRAVKQFTEVYDRGYWGAGSRIADEGYDLFSFAVLYLHVTGQAKDCFSKQMIPQNRSVEWLMEKLDHSSPDYAPILKKALEGKFKSSAEAYQQWKTLFYQGNPPPKERATPKVIVWIQASFIISVVLLLAVLYFYSKG